jgi:hypothetical protein
MESQGLATSELDAPNDTKPDHDKVDNDIIYRVTVDSDLAEDCCTVCHEEFNKGSVAIIALVYWCVSWGLVVLLESLRTAEPPVALITLVTTERELGN